MYVCMYVCMYVLTFMSIHNQRGDYSSVSVSGLQHVGTEYTRTQHTHAHNSFSSGQRADLYTEAYISGHQSLRSSNTSLALVARANLV